jgi:hypothetical protein
MITGINLNETQDFVSKFDSGEVKTTFKLGAIDSECKPVVMANEGQTLETMTMFVRFGLKGFENFQDSAGKEVKFRTEQKVYRGRAFHVVADSIIKIIPTAVILELGMEIMKIGELTEQERKN